MEKKKLLAALTVFITTLLFIGLLSKSDVVKSAYCWDCYGGCQKCVYEPPVGWQCKSEEVRNNFFCFCSGGGEELCNLSSGRYCAQATK